MRVIINRLSAIGKKTGIGHYTTELVRALAKNSTESTITAFPGKELWPLVQCASHFQDLIRRLKIRSKKIQQCKLSQVLALLPKCTWKLFENTAFNLYKSHRDYLFNSDCLDLYHEPNYLPFPSCLPTILTLHDLSVMRFPQWHPTDRVRCFEKHFANGIKQAQHYITDSETIRQEVIRYLHIPSEKVTCVHPGVRSGFVQMKLSDVAAELRSLNLKRGYLLHIGTIEPRKNLGMLMKAYCSLPGFLRSNCPLLLVGPWGWGSQQLATYYDNIGRHLGIRHLGYLPDNLLPALYNGARALVYPSHYEGFGLPPIEMTACGGAVLCSTAEALSETVGSTAELIHPEDGDGWRTSLARIIQDTDWWLHLTKQSQSASTTRVFTWERCAIGTLAVYRKTLGRCEARKHIADHTKLKTAAK